MQKFLNLEEVSRRSRKSYVTLPARSIPRASAVSRRYFRQQLITSLPLVTADLVTIAGVGWIAFLGFGTSGGFLLGLLPYLSIAIIVVNASHGLYPAIGFHPAEELRLCSISTSAVAVTALILGLTASIGAGPLIVGIFAWFGLLIGVPLTRGGARRLASRFDFWAQPVLVVGGGQESEKLIREMQTSRSCGLRPLGIIADPAAQWKTETMVSPASASLCIGTLEEAASIAEFEGVYWAVVISSSGGDTDRALDIESYLYNIPHRLYLLEEQHRNGYETLLAESTRFHT